MTDHVANLIQVALGALGSEHVPKTPDVLNAIEKLKEAKELSLAASSAHHHEVAALKKQAETQPAEEHHAEVIRKKK